MATRLTQSHSQEHRLTISYDVTLADLLAFNLYHSRHSSVMRRQLLMGRIFYSAIVAILVFGVLYFILLQDDEDINRGVLIGAASGAALMYLMYPWLMRISIKRMVEKMVRDSKNVGMLGSHRLELSPDGVFAESDAGSSRLAWKAIEQIAETEQYAFLYVNAMNAIIVPAAAFADRAAYDAFIRAARQYTSAAST